MDYCSGIICFFSYSPSFYNQMGFFKETLMITKSYYCQRFVIKIITTT